MRRIRTDFGDDADQAAQLLGVVESGNQDRERVLAAVVLGARGDVDTLGQLIELSRIDWRDLLVAGGLEHADWATVLADELGSPDAPWWKRLSGRRGN